MIKNIKSNLKRILCILLVFVLITSTFTGCFAEDDEIPAIIPEEQIFEDSYERNEEITDTMTYNMDYITSSGLLFSSSMDVATIFNHVDIQVDNWDCVTVGVTTMGEIAKIVDTVNKNYVTDNTNAVIAERQAIIDAEYEAAKAKAEAKGKTYDKPKKEVRTDDIHFDEPYAYTVTLGDNKKALPEEYKPTLLVDPSTYDVIYFDVTKYGIPYVRFEFVKTSQIYNNKIRQESDWIMNGVKAADVSSYAVNPEDDDELLEVIPSFVDADMLNKAAKQNIFMSGNIAFGGDGFTWDSLMLLCNALQLEEDAREHGFEQSSDDNFTYYTISLHTNPFEYNVGYVEEEKVTMPTTRLVATFDPLTQVCLNWTVDTYTSQKSYNNRVHDVSDPVDVNVHEYQVDTNNYEGMRNTIKSWIESNALKTTTAYCVVDVNNTKNEIAGIIETGSTNLFIEPIIDGVTYSCLESYDNQDGSYLCTYISAEDAEAAEAIDDPYEAEQYVSEHSKTWIVGCYVLNEEGEIIETFTEDKTTMVVNSELCYIASYETSASGYKNVRLLTQDLVNQLLMVYTKTYKLMAAQTTEMQAVFQQNGILAVKDYINQSFAAAEEAQKRQQEEQKVVEETQEVIQGNLLLAETMEPNTEADLSTVFFGDVAWNVKELTSEMLAQNGFAQTDEFSMAANGVLEFGGVNYKNDAGINVAVEEKDGTISAIKVTSNEFKFYNLLQVGMTVDEALTAIADDNVKIVNESFIVLKNAENVLILELDFANAEIVETIYLLNI